MKVYDSSINIWSDYRATSQLWYKQYNCLCSFEYVRRCKWCIWSFTYSNIRLKCLRKLSRCGIHGIIEIIQRLFIHYNICRNNTLKFKLSLVLSHIFHCNVGYRFGTVLLNRFFVATQLSSVNKFDDPKFSETFYCKHLSQKHHPTQIKIYLKIMQM